MKNNTEDRATIVRYYEPAFGKFDIKHHSTLRAAKADAVEFSKTNVEVFRNGRVA